MIVGASAAGLRCACRLARLRPTWSITVVEQRERFSVAACGLPYLLSGDVEGADALRRTGDGMLRDESYFADVKGVSVRSRTRATSIDVAGQRLEVTGADGRAEELHWDELVIATGATPRRLPGQPVHDRVHTLHTEEEAIAIYRQLAAGADLARGNRRRRPGRARARRGVSRPLGRAGDADRGGGDAVARRRRRGDRPGDRRHAAAERGRRALQLRRGRHRRRRRRRHCANRVRRRRGRHGGRGGRRATRGVAGGRSGRWTSARPGRSPSRRSWQPRCRVSGRPATASRSATP